MGIFERSAQSKAFTLLLLIFGKFQLLAKLPQPIIIVMGLEEFAGSREEGGAKRDSCPKLQDLTSSSQNLVSFFSAASSSSACKAILKQQQNIAPNTKSVFFLCFSIKSDVA